MLVGDDILISPKYSRRYYLNLRLSLDSSSKEWEDAVSILKDRINGRFLEPIKMLIDSEPNRNDFSAMALMCLLIDTFMQFRFGLPRSESNESGNNYVRFMKAYLHFDPRDARWFYRDIRCGILHSAETTNGSILDPIHDEETRAIRSFRLDKNKSFLIVNALSMYKTLENYFNSYCNDLLTCDNVECRRNFIIKMDSLTMKLDSLNGDYELWAAICNNADKKLYYVNEKSFTYSISRYERTLIINIERNRDRIRIPFSDIKEFLHFPRANARFMAYSWFIESILKECRAQVKRYTQINVA